MLERDRGRPLLVRAVNVPAFPVGIWLATASGDAILYRHSLTGYYRDHTILHEICHMLADHGIALDESDEYSGLPLRRSQNKDTLFDDFEEEVAETFAALVLKRARTAPRHEVSLVERHAGELLGAPYA